MTPPKKPKNPLDDLFAWILGTIGIFVGGWLFLMFILLRVFNPFDSLLGQITFGVGCLWWIVMTYQFNLLNLRDDP